MLIRGKWLFIDDALVFRVIYVTPSGEVRKADAASPFSYDVAAAMRVA